MNPNRPARLNRALLGLLGLLCILGGAFVIMVGTGILPALLPALTLRSDAPLLAGPPSVPSWVPWAGAVLAILIGLLALRWLIAQTIRRPGSSQWQLTPDDSLGRTYLNSDTAAVPLAEEIADYPGVRSATARLTGTRDHPHLYLRVTTDDRADITDLRHRIDTDAIPRLTRALDLASLPADVLLRLGTATGNRAA